ncbi:hypothetical protein [Neobacillus sp. NPDC093127]|uniref:hypothetical protein n=1 Tax=Neobacillus sp. NPDC093127 TaxID=3364296 RepID=UPI00380D9C65
MDPKQQTLRNKQRERQQRGDDFQEEIRNSWPHVPNVWHIHIKDGGGGTRPADRLVLCEEVNILSELKRTAGERFNLSFLRPNQIRGLIDFDQVIKRNYGLVLVSFHNPKKHLDKAYAFRLHHALMFFHKHSRQYLTLEELEAKKILAIELPRLSYSDKTYDLRGLATCYKYL